MLIKFSTPVEQECGKVFAQFDEKLFEALSPPLMPIKLLRFDGCKKDDEVHLDFPFGQKWISIITEAKETKNQIFFVDEGKLLPFPLKKWQHFHRILYNKEHSIIVDEIYFQTNYLLLDYLVYPLFWLVFGYRKIIYKKKFAD